jgi:hypothetical protein
MIFNFYSARINTQKRPECPRCGKPELDRRMSLFSISKGRQEEEGGDEDMPDIDESRMERAMEMMSREADRLDEDNPRQAAQLMRKLFKESGLEFGPGMEEAVRRMEAGEDPEQIEAELGDSLEEEDIITRSKRILRRKAAPPAVDETLYTL